MRMEKYQAYTRGLCPACKRIVDGKIIYDERKAYVEGHCPEHGYFKGLLEENVSHHMSKSSFEKPITQIKPQTKVDKGCPHDCGLCPSHAQHSCISLIEITDKCNLGCEMCYARGKGSQLPIEQIEKMMDFIVDAEGGSAEILQISGGEPTEHPDVIKVISLARTKPIKYVMLNTNGIRIAQDENFVKELSQFKGSFEIYLQLDTFDDEKYITLRGKRLVGIKNKALENLAKYEIPVTLVSTIQKGVNDDEVGELVIFAMNTKGVRGINFQPVAYFSADDSVDPLDRTTLTGVVDLIEKQTNSMIGFDDMSPLPCDPDRVFVCYMLRKGSSYIPVTSKDNNQALKEMFKSTFYYTMEGMMETMKDSKDLFKSCGCVDISKQVMKLLPKDFILKSKEEKIRFIDENTFRLSIVSFVDVYNFDIKSLQKECVHIITPDLKRVPFSSYNLFRR